MESEADPYSSPLHAVGKSEGERSTNAQKKRKNGSTSRLCDRLQSTLHRSLSQALDFKLLSISFSFLPSLLLLLLVSNASSHLSRWSSAWIRGAGRSPAVQEAAHVTAPADLNILQENASKLDRVAVEQQPDDRRVSVVGIEGHVRREARRADSSAFPQGQRRCCLQVFTC